MTSGAALYRPKFGSAIPQRGGHVAGVRVECIKRSWGLFIY